VGIPLTGTSVNPARSIGPAIFAGGAALTDLWVFIAAPLAGAILAVLVYKAVKQKA
jgi:aquaporin Z